MSSTGSSAISKCFQNRKPSARICKKRMDRDVIKNQKNEIKRLKVTKGLTMELLNRSTARLATASADLKAKDNEVTALLNLLKLKDGEVIQLSQAYNQQTHATDACLHALENANILNGEVNTELELFKENLFNMTQTRNQDIERSVCFGISIGARAIVNASTALFDAGYIPPSHFMVYQGYPHFALVVGNNGGWVDYHQPNYPQGVYGQ